MEALQLNEDFGAAGVLDESAYFVGYALVVFVYILKSILLSFREPAHLDAQYCGPTAC